MAFEFELAELVQLGQDITSFKLYTICLAAVWFYDYFLTVGDEIRYAWKTESIPMFGLFLFTRYLPAPFLVWTIVASWSLSYTSEVWCARTAFIEPTYFALITGSAQVVLAQRTYAITRKNKWIAGILYTVAAVQFCLGIHLSVRTALNQVATLPAIPLDSYHLCVPNAGLAQVTALVSISLAFDIAVFVFVVVQARRVKSIRPGAGAPVILNTVSRDAQIYFAIISSSQILVLIMYSAAPRPVIRGIAMLGNSVFMPMMITRMFISLRKVASSQRRRLDLEVPTGSPTHLQDGYSPRAVNIIPLPVLKREHYLGGWMFGGGAAFVNFGMGVPVPMYRTLSPLSASPGGARF